MQYVNPGIIGQYQQQAPGAVQSLQEGLKLKDMMQQSQQQQTAFGQQQVEYNKQQEFSKALDEEAKKVDFTKPQGQLQLVQNLAAKGFGPEAIHLAQSFPQPKPKTFTAVPTTQGLQSFDTETGKGSPMVGQDGQPLMDEKSADKQKASKADFNFGKSIPNYEAALKAIGSDTTKRDLLASKISSDFPDSPRAEKYIAQVVKSASPVMSGEITPRDKLRLENNFRNQSFKENQTYEKQAGPFINIMSAKNSKGFGTGIGDQALVDDFVSFQSKGAKATSAQYKEAMSSYGLGDIMDKITGRLTTGAKLPPKVREDIINTVQSQMADYHQRHLDLKDELTNELTNSGGNPTNVFKSSKYENTVGKYLAPAPDAAPAASGAPKVGTVEDGHKFKGGNPADPNSWEKVQ